MRLPQPLTMGQWFADDWIDSPIYVSQEYLCTGHQPR